MITSSVEDYCRCCGCERLFMYLDLGNQPLANDYHDGLGAKEIFPLEVNVCQKCWHSQLSIVVNPKLMFDNYLYVSGTTYTFRQHCDELAEEAVKMELYTDLRVLDIACNDGTLLESFRAEGADVYGVDPALNLLPITEEKKIPVIGKYWGNYDTTISVVQEFGGDFDIIVGTNVFAHVANVDAFLNEAKAVLAENGLIILEFPYGVELFENNEFDTVYHEHLSYFLVKSFKALVDRLGLTIVRIVRTPIHGGSIRFYLRENGVESLNVRKLIIAERKKGLHELGSYIEFSKRVLENKLRFKHLVKELQRQGNKVVGYGASAKGNTMLNYLNVHFDFIVDDNPLKWGYYTPGQNIEIKSPAALDVDEPLHIAVLAWNFLAEIQQKVEAIRGERETHYILYTPESRLL